MNGIEKITSRITAEAESAAAAVMAEAETQAAGIRAEYEKKAQEAFDTRMAAGKQEIEQAAERVRRAARLDAKKSVLGLKQAMLLLAYDSAKEKIVNLPEEEYVAFLAQQAGAAALSGKEEIILNAEDRKRVGDKVVAAANAAAAERGIGGGLTLSSETREIAGGVILREGSVEVNCSVESLLDMSHNRLDAEVTGILFR